MKKLLAILLIVIMIAGISGCQTSLPLLKPTPTHAPTLTFTPSPTFTPLTPTLTPTPVTEENEWKASCDSIAKIGRLGEGEVTDIAFSKNGRWMTVTSGAGVSLYDRENQNRVWLYTSSVPIIQTVFVNSDLIILALDQEYRLITIGASTGQKLSESNSVDAMRATISPDGKYVALSDWLGATYIYDTQQFNLVASTEAYIKKNEMITLFMSDLIYSHTLFSSDSRQLVTVAFTGRITVFNTTSGTVVAEYPLDERAIANNVALSGNGQYLAVEYRNEDGTSRIQILSTSSGFIDQTFDGTQPTLSEDGKLLVTYQQDQLLVWDTRSGELLQALKSPSHSAGIAILSPDGNTLYNSTNQGVEVWDIAVGSLSNQMPGNFTKYERVSVSQNGQLIALKSVQHIEVKDFETGELVTEITTEAPIKSISLNLDGTKLMGVLDEQIMIWDPITGAILEQVNYSADFGASTKMPDAYIVAKNYTDIAMVKIANGDITKLTTESLKATDFAAAPDGSLIVTNSYDNGIMLTASDGWKMVKRLGSTKSLSENLAFAPSGMVFASANNDDQVIIVWNVSGNKICTIEDQPKFVKSIAFSSDGASLFVITNEGLIQILGADATSVPEWIYLE